MLRIAYSYQVLNKSLNTQHQPFTTIHRKCHSTGVHNIPFERRPYINEEFEFLSLPVKLCRMSITNITLIPDIEFQT